ncbi:MAG: regulator, partial [Thermoactinospora sp.]|nr:regulator [Thermoactinospora sp.]
MPPAARAVDLPSAVTSFVGRRLEVSALVGALDSHRLVTVVGPGGVGKTRLTLQAVAAISHRYDGGVRMIELSGLRDPDLLPGA